MAWLSESLRRDFAELDFPVLLPQEHPHPPAQGQQGPRRVLGSSDGLREREIGSLSQAPPTPANSQRLP